MPAARPPETRGPLMRMNVLYQASLTADRKWIPTLETGPRRPVAQAKRHPWKYEIHVLNGGWGTTTKGQHTAAHPHALAPRTLWTGPPLVGTRQRAYM